MERAVLLKIKRQFTESEAVKVLQQELAAAQFRVGELSSEVAELRDTVKNLRQDVHFYKQKAAAKPTPSAIEAELRKGMQTQGQKNKALEDQVRLWQKKYFDLENSLRKL